MPAISPAAYGQGPTCFSRMKMGFGIGFCVGLASGALFGGFSALRCLLYYSSYKSYFSYYFCK